jgi:type I restriction enzyme, S subunit
MNLLPLEKVAVINYGTRVTRKKDAGSTYPVYGGGGETFRLDTYNRENCTIVSRFAMSEECVRFVEGKFFLNDSGLSVAAKTDYLDQEFLDLFLFSSAKRIYELGRGTAQKNLEVDAFRKMPVPVPSIDEQKRVVSELKTALGFIDTYREVSDSHTGGDANLFESFLESQFLSLRQEYALAPASELLDVRDGTHDSPKFLPEGYPFITSKNLRDGKLDFGNVKYISQKDFDDFNKRSKVNKGDLLFGMIGTIGNPVVVGEHQPFAIKNVALVKSNQDYDLEFLRYYYLTPSVKSAIELSTKGTTQKFVGLGNLRNFPIPRVPLHVQRDAIERIREIESNCQQLREIDFKLKQAVAELRMSFYGTYFGTAVA